MTLSMETLREIDIFLEEFYPQSQTAGRELARALPEKSQIRNLETLVISTRRFSEIKNFIKNQAGKEKEANPQWRRVAPNLLKQLEELENQAATLSGGDPGRTLAIKLHLARGWVKQVVANYLFALLGQN